MTSALTLRDRITTDDLKWWLDLAPTLTWTFAKTYAETAPHSYVVEGRTAGMSREDYVRAGAVIRTFGQPGKYFSMTNIYLTNRDGSLKWWAMDRRVADTTLINQATTDRVYGVQDAPVTASGLWSVYDEIATDYDRFHSPVDGDEKVAFVRLMRSLEAALGVAPGSAPTVLDIGCGTGALLDLGVTDPSHYTAVDPSQGMLNELVMKYSKSRFARIHAGRIEDVLLALEGQTFDLVIAAFGSASYVAPEVLAELPRFATGACVLMNYADGYRPAYAHPDSRSVESTDRAGANRSHGSTGLRETRREKFQTLCQRGQASRKISA